MLKKKKNALTVNFIKSVKVDHLIRFLENVHSEIKKNKFQFLAQQRYSK